MATAMKLPPEILIAIVPSLDFPDIKSIRQCSKLLAREGSRALFQTLIVYCKSISFAHLRAVARHNDFRLHVRQIVYVPNRYVPNMNLAQWRHHYSNGSRGNFGTAVWLGKPYDMYKSLSSEQEGLVNDGRAANIWTACLPCLPGLIDIRIALLEAQKPGQGLLQSMIASTFCEPDGDFESDGLIENTKTVIQVQAVFTRLTHLYQRQLERSNTVPKLRVLHLEGVSARLVSNLAELSSVGTTSSFSNLRALCVQYVVSKHDWDIDSEAVKAIGKIIATAPNLSNVEVDIARQHFRLGFDHFRLGFEDIFTTEQSWPMMRNVKLHGIAFKCQDLRDFIQRFRSCLSALTISASDERFEETSSWQECVDHLVSPSKILKLLKLSSNVTAAELEGIFDGATIEPFPSKEGYGLTATWT